MNGPDLIKRFENLRNAAANHIETWDRIAPYIAPSRFGIRQGVSPGARVNQHVYDSTTLMSAELMAHFIASHVINPSQKWLSWIPEDPELQEDDESKEWCEESRDRYLQALGSSAFYADGPEALIDYGGFGTGCLIQEEAPSSVNVRREGFKGFYVKAEKTGRFFIAEDALGIVDTLFREFSYSARVMGDLVTSGFFTSVSDKVKNISENPTKQDELIKVVHAIIPRPFAEQSSGAKGMPWASVWIEYESKHICRESGYPSFPAAVPRYHKTPGEVFGRGRGELAFPDTWTLNTAKKMSLEDWALKIKPPIAVRHDSVFGTLKMTPGAAFTLKTHNQRIQDVAMPWQTGSHPEVSNVKEEELRRSIRQIFFVEQILALLQVEKSEMTAFEFAKKIELLFKLLGPVYGRLRREFLYTISEIGFEIMYNARAFSPPPLAMLRSSGRLRTRFNNPLDLAQGSHEAEALALMINDLAPLAQALGVEQVFDRLNVDETVAGIYKARGIPARWERSTQEIEQRRAARQQQQQTEADTQTALQYAEGAQKVAPLIKVLQGGKTA